MLLKPPYMHNEKAHNPQNTPNEADNLLLRSKSFKKISIPSAIYHQEPNHFTQN